MSTTTQQANINFSQEVLDYIAEEIHKNPTEENAENLGRWFACCATSMTTNPQGVELFNNRAGLIENAPRIADAIENPALAKAYLESAEKTYVFQKMGCRSEIQKETPDEFLANLERCKNDPSF